MEANFAAQVKVLRRLFTTCGTSTFISGPSALASINPDPITAHPWFGAIINPHADLALAFALTRIPIGRPSNR